MKTIVKSLFVGVVLIATSCKKESCTSCYIETSAPGASSYKTYCGTDAEINKEDVRLKNDCQTLKKDYPQYTFNCGCD